MPEMDEVTPGLAPAHAPHIPLLSPLQLPGRDDEDFPEHPAVHTFDLHAVPLSPNGKAAASALFVLSSSHILNTGAAHTAGTKRPHAMDEDDERMSKRIRSSRCGTCSNCLRPDCGKCINCSDKPKFGGPGVKKQACSARKCLCPNRALNFREDGRDDHDEDEE
mmetsp:Transcript_13362/g.39360  ORF Transcript_13362/g.39360 Transcript_13362/m.39360 type:complete len:164 (+) Transcript_13362:142-633(+)